MEQFQDLQDLNIHSSCRTCLENLNDIDIHHDIFVVPDLQKKLAACSSLPVEQGDDLPTSLCESCYTKIDDLYTFQQMCIFSWKRFQDYIQMEKKPCSIEFAIDSKNLPTNLVILTEAKKESEEEDPISLDQYSEIVKIEPSVYLENQIESSSNDSTTIKENECIPDYTVPQKKKDRSSTKINLECEICKKCFKKIERFEAHMRVHQGLKAFPCQLCEKSYARRSRLKLHMKANHEGRPKEKFPCTEQGCDRIMSTKQTLRQHIRDIHSNNGYKSRQPYVCEDCGKVLTSLSTLKNHRFLHTGQQLPHECPQCQKRYMTKNKLQVHMNRHAGIRNYICPQCGAKKVTQNELRKHLNSHTKEKKYPCQFCDMVFYSVWNINRHKRIVHEGIKDFPCSYCDKSFGKAETRKHHEMTHTGEKPHECNICHKKFIQPTALKKHKKVHLKETKSHSNEKWLE